MDYIALRIPNDTKNKMTSSTWTGEPPWQGSNGMYEQCGCELIQPLEAAYTDIRTGIHLEGELLCDEEALMKNLPRNMRASQLRYWYLKKIEDQLTPDWRAAAYIAGDAVFVIEGTDKNLKIMEDILDS